MSDICIKELHWCLPSSVQCFNISNTSILATTQHIKSGFAGREDGVSVYDA